MQCILGSSVGDAKVSEYNKIKACRGEVPSAPTQTTREITAGCLHFYWTSDLTTRCWKHQSRTKAKKHDRTWNQLVARDCPLSRWRGPRSGMSSFCHQRLVRCAPSTTSKRWAAKAHQSPSWWFLEGAAEKTATRKQAHHPPAASDDANETVAGSGTKSDDWMGTAIAGDYRFLPPGHRWRKCLNGHADVACPKSKSIKSCVLMHFQKRMSKDRIFSHYLKKINKCEHLPMFFCGLMCAICIALPCRHANKNNIPITNNSL